GDSRRHTVDRAHARRSRIRRCDETRPGVRARGRKRRSAPGRDRRAPRVRRNRCSGSSTRTRNPGRRLRRAHGRGNARDERRGSIVRGLIAVYRREMLSLWVTPLAWVLLFVFLMLQGASFYQILLHFASFSNVSIDQGPVQAYFGQSLFLVLSL